MRVILKPAGLFLILGAMAVMATLLFLQLQGRKLDTLPETAPIEGFKTKRTTKIPLFDDPSKMPPINLTQSGKLDWIHWSGEKVRAAARKQGGKAFGELTLIAPQAGVIKEGERGPSRGVLWSDGKSGATKSAVTYGAIHAGGRSGFRFEVTPGDAAKHTVRVYVGGWKTDAAFDARMSDGSSTEVKMEEAALPNFYYSRVYTVNFETTAPDRSLTIEWKNAGANSNISLQAATLE